MSKTHSRRPPAAVKAPAATKRARAPKCKKSKVEGGRNQALSPNGKPPAVLKRTTFKTSREMDFFSEKELVTQTGHEKAEWPFVFLKEAIDNALDACEDFDVPPVIDVAADATSISVRDNGPGLPESTLAGALDFTVRTSSREQYSSPTRGAQGNALKTLLTMPWVIDPDAGQLVILADGKRHVLKCGADPISQRAIVNDDVSDDRAARKGTEIRIEWALPLAPAAPHECWPFGVWDPEFSDLFRAIVEGFAVFNPHLTISLDWFGDKTTWKATNTAWEKWKPCRPTSSHWYEQRHLERLIGAYVTHDREHDSDRLISDFIAEFDGLSGSRKRSKILDDTDLRRVPLSALVLGDRLDGERIGRLLQSMQSHTRPVNPRRLGIIGEDHLKARLLAMGADENSFRYSRKLSKDGLPWVLESAFGYLGDEAFEERRIHTGANWSAAIKNPFRSFGATGEGLETVLSDLRATSSEPVVFVLHLAHPRVEYVDRGKSALVIGGAA